MGITPRVVDRDRQNKRELSNHVGEMFDVPRIAVRMSGSLVSDQPSTTRLHVGS